jgi:long-chain acyl-CoA synthetase
MILSTAALRPSDIALDDLERRLTWRELDDRVRRVARLLRDDLGLAPEDHAALLMGNRVEAVELVIGAMLAGVWLTPINHHLTAEEIAYIIEDSGAHVVFTDAEHEAVARAAIGPSSEPPEILVAGASLERAIASASDEPLPDDGPPGATMIYTSGTTGRPKGVKRARAATVREALSAAVAAGLTLGLDGSGPHLVTGPLYHAAPLLFAVYDMFAGAPVVLMPRWDPHRTLDLIEERGIRHTHLVPTMFVRLLRLPEAVRTAFDPSSLSVVLHGAAPITAEVKRAMIDWWGPVLVEYWGATESGVATLVGSADWLAHPGTVGRATASFEVFAADDAGKRLAPGDVGTLYLRHKKLSKPFEYHLACAKTGEAYLDGGAFTIGDIGRVDADGYVYLADRKSHTIISGGVNIYPAEVEEMLQRHPAVADVAVFGIPDDEWGEQVKAAVELAEGWTASPALAEELIAFARAHLAGYKAPRSIDFEARLPRYPTGKLHTRLLRDPYWKGRERRI